MALCKLTTELHLWQLYAGSQKWITVKHESFLNFDFIKFNYNLSLAKLQKNTFVMYNSVVMLMLFMDFLFEN